MKLTRKIAAGLVLGIVAVLLMLGVPSWRASSREAHYRRLLWNLNPDDALARCGRPLNDRTLNLCPRCDNPPMLRTLTYKGARAGNVLLQFSVSRQDEWFWAYLSMKDELSGRRYETFTAQAFQLPCLVAGR